MPFLLAEILNFQGSTHLIGVGSLSYIICSDNFLLSEHRMKGGKKYEPYNTERRKLGLNQDFSMCVEHS